MRKKDYTESNNNIVTISQDSLKYVDMNQLRIKVMKLKTYENENFVYAYTSRVPHLVSLLNLHDAPF